MTYIGKANGVGDRIWAELVWHDMFESRSHAHNEYKNEGVDKALRIPYAIPKQATSFGLSQNVPRRSFNECDYARPRSPSEP